MNARVAALVATYRRPREITRLLAALAQIPHGLEIVVPTLTVAVVEDWNCVDVVCLIAIVSPELNPNTGAVEKAPRDICPARGRMGSLQGAIVSECDDFADKNQSVRVTPSIQSHACHG